MKQTVLNIMSVCLYSCLSYPACKAHFFCVELNSHLQPTWLYHIFTHYLINGTTSAKTFLNIKCLLIFSPNLSEIYLILRRIQRDIIINLHMSSCKVSIVLVRVQPNLNFHDRVFEKSSNIKFHEHPSGGSRFVPCGQTDRQTHS